MRLTDLIADLQTASIGATDATPIPTQIDGFTLLASRTPTAILHQIYQPIFCLVLQGAKQATIGSQTLLFGQGRSLVVSVDLPAVSRIIQASHTAPYLALALTLDMAEIRALSADIAPSTADRPGLAATTLATDDAIQDAMARLYRLTAQPAAIPILAPLIRREIHYWLLMSDHGPQLRGLVQADARQARIARAIHEIRCNFAAPLPVEDLANLAGMSVSAFHAHFRTITGTSPRQFHKQLKLTEARWLIQSSRCSITEAAFEVGYESPTQFSRDYARHFGRSPRQDRDPIAL